MERRIFVTGIIAVFIVLETASAGANAMSTETQNNSGVNYLIFGRISSYNIVESNRTNGTNGTRYLEGRAIRLRILVWGVFPNFPNLIMPETIRFGQRFAIPFEGANITGPNPLGNYFLVARGTL